MAGVPQWEDVILAAPQFGKAPFADLRARFHNCSCKNGRALASIHSLRAPILVSNTEGKGDPSGIVGHS